MTTLKKKTGSKKKAAKKTTTKAKPAASTPAARTGHEYLVKLQPRHSAWVEAIAAAFGRTPEHQIEKFVREAFAQDPNRARGDTAVKDTDNLSDLLQRKKPA